MKYQWQLYHWHIELSSKCTLKCPRCPRTEFPNTKWKNQDIDINTFKESFTELFIKTNILRFTLCGDIGDPIYNNDFLEICGYIKKANPTCHIFIITNGSYKKEDWWTKLSKILNEYDTINFSVDGYDNQTNNIYRINSNFDSIMAGMKIMGHYSNAFVSWSSIYFNFNQNHQEKIKKLATENNCDQIQWNKRTKFGSKYGEAYGGELDQLEPSAEYISSSDRYERHVEYISSRRINNKQYLECNEKKYTQYKNEYNNIIPLCLVGNRGMYISADGVIHPCSWTSFPFNSLSDGEKTIQYNDSFFFKNRENISIKHKSLDSILNDPIWDGIFGSWQNNDKSWVECKLKCNANIVNFDYAVGYETN